jgi:hypothetical protein
MSRPVFADPKTDFVFQRIFGSEDHKLALIGFLNDVAFLPPEQRPKVNELKYSIVAQLDGPGLDALLARLRAERRWP